MFSELESDDETDKYIYLRFYIKNNKTQCTQNVKLSPVSTTKAINIISEEKCNIKQEFYDEI